MKPRKLSNSLRGCGWCLLTILLLGSLLPAASATPLVLKDENQDDCLLVVYTKDDRSPVITLVGSNFETVGQSMVVASTCGPVELHVGNRTANGIDNLELAVPEGLQDVNIRTSYSNYTFYDVYVWASSDAYILDEFNEIENEGRVQTTESAMWWDTIIAHIVTFLILFIMSTSIIYRMASRAVDIEVEVVV